MKKQNNLRGKSSRRHRAPRHLVYLLLGLMGGTVLHAQTATESEVAGELEELATVGGDDPNFILPTQPIEGALGFSKSIVDTPRSVSVVSSEMLSSLAIAEVSDLSRIVPNANTTTRWGIQGNIDIRNMTADTYFRGMKRIEPQGNSRTVLQANDQIEVVRGPAPAYFGSGKIGGYTNMTPKSGRSRQGAYLDESTGFVEFTVGDDNKRVASFGYGGPLKIGNPDLNGGYYIFGLIEDSDSYYTNIPLGQRVLQAAVSREITKKWRVETGINYQETSAAGGFRNRLTQDYVDRGVYWGGRALVNLDTDGSGKISQEEMFLGSPLGTFGGTPTSNNRELSQRFYGTSASNGSRFTAALAGPTPTGAGANADSALAALFAANPAFVGIMEGDPQYADNLKLLNVLQQGFVFDPATMQETKADNRNVALEKELLAKLGLFYLDFVNDSNENAKFKNQILFDSQDQFKDSELPFYQKQDVWVVENKATLEYKIPETIFPDFIQVNSITSANLRYTDASRRSNSGDYDDRPDLSLSGNVRTPYDTFISPKENDDYFNGGAPYSADTTTTYSEVGIGTLFDITIGEKLSVIAGGRLDYIQADTVNPPGLYRQGTNGVFTTPVNAATSSGEGDDYGKSTTLSASYKAPFGLVPYATIASQTALSDSSDLTLAGNLARAGAYDTATLEEIGVKGTFLEGKLYAAVALYRQERSTVTADPGGNPLLGGLGNVKGEGVEIEARYAPNKNFWIAGFTVFQKTEIVTTSTDFVRVHGEALGFTDVLDPVTGNVIYPAEAFTWGGQASVGVPATVKTEYPSYPNTSHGLQAQYTFDNGFSVTGSGNYISAVHSGRLQTITLPAATTFNMGLGYKKGDWAVKLDIKNVTDETYFRGRNGTGAGDVLISAMPGRQWQFTVTKTF
jgi:iron complex outermembrane receptor protein